MKQVSPKNPEHMRKTKSSTKLSGKSTNDVSKESKQVRINCLQSKDSEKSIIPKTTGCQPLKSRPKDYSGKHVKESEQKPCIQPKQVKSEKQTNSGKNDSKVAKPVSSAKPQVHRKFKKKPWQKYNARTTNGQHAQESCSSSGDESDNNQEKYKKRAIVDNSTRFQETEDPHLPGSDEEESDDFSNLCEIMKTRERNRELAPISRRKGHIPDSVVLPKDFEEDLDQLLSLSATYHHGTQSAPVLGYDDPQSFSKWLEEC